MGRRSQTMSRRWSGEEVLDDEQVSGRGVR